MQISYPGQLWSGYASAGNASASGDSNGNAVSREPVSAQVSGSAVEINSLRLQLVEMASRILEHLPSKAALSTTEQQTLQDMLRSILEQNSSDAGRLRNLLQWTSSLEQTLARPENREALQSLIHAFPGTVSQGDSPVPTIARELLDILARNDFQRLPEMAQALRIAPPESQDSLARTWLPLLSAVQELSSLGLPSSDAAPSPGGLVTALSDLRQQILEHSAIPLSKDVSTSLKQTFPDSVSVGSMFSAQVTQVNAHNLELNGKLPLPLPAGTQWPQVLSPGQTLLFSVESLQSRSYLQPWPASAQIPAGEQNYWQQSGLPPTAQALDTRDFLAQYGTLPADPLLAGQMGKAIHQLSLLPSENHVSPEQKDLLFRMFLLNRSESLSNTVLESLQRYTNSTDTETELFQKLPSVIRERILAEVPPGSKALEPAILQSSVERALEQLRGTPQEDVRQTLQQLKEHLQWTRLDQDTRHPADREQVFYWMHAGELQKGRLRVRDERKSRSPDTGKAKPVVFSVEAKLPRLGKVLADLTLWKERLDVQIADEQGLAQEAVQAERTLLVQELMEMGLELGNLGYGKQENIPESRSAETFLPGSSGGRLDLKG